MSREEQFLNPVVSVIVPVYNCEKYIEKCLLSIKKQTFRNFEVIIVNNGSTDGTQEIINRFDKDDSRFKVYSQDNQGICGSRNRGLNESKGKYVCFIDADDFVEPDYCKKMVEAIQLTDSDIAICDYAMTYRTREIKSILNLQNGECDTSKITNYIFYLRYIARNPVVWNKMYKKQMIENADIRFELQHGEDLLFHLRLLPHINKVTTISDTLYHYVQRSSSAAHGLNEVNKQNIAILETYMKGIDEKKGMMSYYAFSSIYTGFISSAYCINRDVNYFVNQICAMEKAEFFEEFCKTIAFSDKLKDLYIEKAVSHKFYLIQKLQFALCLLKWKLPAAVFMWLCSKLIQIKNRRIPREQFD